MFSVFGFQLKEKRKCRPGKRGSSFLENTYLIVNLKTENRKLKTQGAYAFTQRCD